MTLAAELQNANAPWRDDDYDLVCQDSLCSQQRTPRHHHAANGLVTSLFGDDTLEQKRIQPPHGLRRSKVDRSRFAAGEIDLLVIACRGIAATLPCLADICLKHPTFNLRHIWQP